MRLFAQVMFLLVGLCLASTGKAQAKAYEECKDGVCTVIEHTALDVIIAVRNSTDTPVGIKIKFPRLQNFRVDGWPGSRPVVTTVIPAKSTEVAATLQPIDQSIGSRYAISWTWVFGDPHAKHDKNARYSTPYGGSEERILSQGVNGKFTHNGLAKYSFDFPLPVGTPILASRSGLVMRITDGHIKAGLTKDMLTKANSVTILHDDNTFATYGHLDPGAGARAGMRVYAGDLIGFSGNTGFSTGPHLHFSVWKPNFDLEQKTLPIKFYDSKKPSGFVPTEGHYYAAGCSLDAPKTKKCKMGDLPPDPGREKRDSQGASFTHGEDGACHCANGAVMWVKLPCHMVCGAPPKVKKQARGKATSSPKAKKKIEEITKDDIKKRLQSLYGALKADDVDRVMQSFSKKVIFNVEGANGRRAQRMTYSGYKSAVAEQLRVQSDVNMDITKFSAQVAEDQKTASCSYVLALDYRVNGVRYRERRKTNLRMALEQGQVRIVYQTSKQN